MKNVIKWVFIIGGGLFLLAALVLLVVPFFMDVNKFKPEIESRISEATGRPFSIKGEIDLSLFPWAGLSIADSSMGNPEGFKEKEFVSIEAFDIRVKLIPLLSRDIQLKRFVLKRPKIMLVTQKNGKVNYDFSEKAAKKDLPEKKKGEQQVRQGLPIKSLNVGEFLISDGLVLIFDHAKGTEQEISEITARLDNVSLDRTIDMLFSAKIDQMPISLKGDVGPVGENYGKGNIPVNLILTALENLEIRAKGQLIDLADNPRFDLMISSNSFSPKKLLKSLNKGTELQTADADALNKLSFKTELTGGPKAINLTTGNMTLDDTNISFECTIKAFEKPDVSFRAELDKIDADRYLPPKPAGTVVRESSPKGSTAAKSAGSSKKTDYTPLRSLVLNGNLKAGDIKINNVKMNNLSMKITGSKGIFKIDPFVFSLYEGSVNLTSVLNVQSDVPNTSLTVKADKIQANPLIKAIIAKDVIEGGLKADLDIQMAGDDSDTIKRTLDGNADIVFRDGAIKGIDLTAMAQNIKSAFGGSKDKAATGQARTDFSELSCPLVIRKGVANTAGAKMVSPLLRVDAKGNVDLVKELLDLRVEPKFVATISGQGDALQRSGIMVPILITGSFSSPKFAPDVGGIIKQGLEGGIPKMDDLKSIIKGGGSQTTDEKSPQGLKETTEGLLKKLPFGR